MKSCSGKTARETGFESRRAVLGWKRWVWGPVSLSREEGLGVVDAAEFNSRDGKVDYKSCFQRIIVDARNEEGTDVGDCATSRVFWQSGLLRSSSREILRKGELKKLNTEELIQWNTESSTHALGEFSGPTRKSMRNSNGSIILRKITK